MNDTNLNGYGTDDAYGSSGYNSPGYQSPGYEAPGYKSSGYGNGTGYGSTEATDQQQAGYAPPDTWASGYQENVYDRANLLDTPYLDTAANPNPDYGAIFNPDQASINSYGTNRQSDVPPLPLPKPNNRVKPQLNPNSGPYHSNTFELDH